MALRVKFPSELSPFCLTAHTQSVVLENIKSSPVTVSSGVLQGTVLDPMLFLIFINDLLGRIYHSTLRLFTDDWLLYKMIKSAQDAVAFQQDLLAMQTWEDTWLMRFNISKFFVMRVTQSTKYRVIHDDQLHNTTLNSINHCKYVLQGCNPV